MNIYELLVAELAKRDALMSLRLLARCLFFVHLQKTFQQL